MGYPPTDVDDLALLVRHHLLLPDVATRRDLEDEDTIRFVAEEIDSVNTLELLGALTEADSIATSQSAWGLEGRARRRSSSTGPPTDRAG